MFNPNTIPLRHLQKILAICASVLLWLSPNLAHANLPTEPERTLSPYFFVQSHDVERDYLPLKSTATTVIISGIIADVSVTQTYAHQGDRPISALYVFPASTRATMHSLTMTIGGRTITSRIEKREHANREPSGESRLGFDRPNVYEMKLKNILPGNEIRVELRYTEMVAVEAGSYKFVFPSLIGTRYRSEPTGLIIRPEPWKPRSTLEFCEPPTHDNDIQVQVSSGMPLTEIVSTNHQIDTQFDAPGSVSIHQSSGNSTAGDRDFILRYRHAGEQIEKGLLLYQGRDENYFLLMAQPPKLIDPQDWPKREQIFIVDIPSSEQRLTLEATKRVLHDLIVSMPAETRINLVLLGDTAILADKSLPANIENIEHLIAMIDRAGSTQGAKYLLPAVEKAFALERLPGYFRSIVIVANGNAIQDKEKVLKRIRETPCDANIVPVSIGKPAHGDFLQQLTRAGATSPVSIWQDSETTAKIERLRTLLTPPVLAHMQVDFGGFRAYDIEPQCPRMMADKPFLLFGKWRGDLWTRKPSGTIRIRGVTGREVFDETLNVEHFEPSAAHSALAHLWARHHIDRLRDIHRLTGTQMGTDEITELGLKHELVTPYTSFVAIDSSSPTDDGASKIQKQRLPVPEAFPRFRMAPDTASPRLRFISTIRFPYSSATLNIAGQKDLDELIGKLRLQPKFQFEVALATGHADANEHRRNSGLAARRADVVRRYLLSKGLEEKRVYTESKGDSQPITWDGLCKDQRRRQLIACTLPDRRVELEVIVAVPY